MKNSVKIASTDVSIKNRSDESLIALCQEGDKESFGILVERYQERIRNLIYSIFNDPSMIDDMAQEVFIKAYESIALFRMESSFYTWLYRIAVNKSRDEMRRRKIRKFLSLQTMLDAIDTELLGKTAVEMTVDDAKDHIDKALAKMPEKFRLPVVLRDVDGFSYEEIADILQCEVGTVKSRLSRGRSILRKLLQPLMKEGL
jgi:RNA polymerase sigma-70 factor (ECF subfamily)